MLFSLTASCHLVRVMLYTTRHYALHVGLPVVYILLFELIGMTLQQDFLLTLASNGEPC